MQTQPSIAGAILRRAEALWVEAREHQYTPSVWLTASDCSVQGDVIMIRLSARRDGDVPFDELTEIPVVYTIRQPKAAEYFSTRDATDAVEFLRHLGVSNPERLIEQVRKWRAVEMLEEIGGAQRQDRTRLQSKR
jgi:hypothetical protein